MTRRLGYWTREKIAARRAKAEREIEICLELLDHVDDPVPARPKKRTAAERAIASRKRAIHASELRDTGLTYREIGNQLGVTGGQASAICAKGYRFRRHPKYQKETLS